MTDHQAGYGKLGNKEMEVDVGPRALSAETVRKHSAQEQQRAAIAKTDKIVRDAAALEIAAGKTRFAHCKLCYGPHRPDGLPFNMTWRMIRLTAARLVSTRIHTSFPHAMNLVPMHSANGYLRSSWTRCLG